MPSKDLYTVTPIYQPKLVDFEHDRTRTKVRKEGEYQFEDKLTVFYGESQDARRFCSFGDKCSVPKEFEAGDIPDEVSKCEYAERQGCPFNFSTKDLSSIIFEFSDNKKNNNKLKKSDDDLGKDFFQVMHTLHGFPFFKSGTFNGVTFTDDDLDKIVNNFQALKNQVKPVLKFGHGPQRFLKSEGMPALGWVESIRRSDSLLLADIGNIPERIYNLIKNKAYRRPSAEVYRNFKDETGTTHGPVLSGIALLGAEPPAIKTLPDIELLFNNDKFNDVMTVFNENASRNEDPTSVEFKEDNDSGGTGGKNVPDEITEEMKADLAELETLRAQKADVEARETAIEEAEDNQAQLEENRRLRSHQEFLSERKKQGKVLPVHEPKLLAVMAHLSDDSTDSDNMITLQEEGKNPRSLTPLSLFKEVFNGMPDIVKLKELSDVDGKGKNNSEDDFEKKFKERMTSESDKVRNIEIGDLEIAELAEKIQIEKKISYSEALVEASAQITV